MGTYNICFILSHLYCLVGCLSMIVWIHVVLDVLHVLHIIFACSAAQLSTFPMERPSRNAIIIISILLVNNYYHY